MSSEPEPWTAAPYDFVIVGGGIVGLSTAMHLLREMPWSRVGVIEKEPRLAVHQTGRNSGVIHAGIYYKPGSAKARLATRGNQSMVEFCREHALPLEVCGKLIIAAEPAELPRLQALYDRGIANGLSPQRLNSSQIREREPACAGIAGLFLPTTGITDFHRVALTYAKIIGESGGTICLGCALQGVQAGLDETILHTSRGPLRARWWINCGGLQCDRIAAMAGVQSGARIVPFRGDYFELRPERRGLVRGLIYPVPDPNFPFLGVHLTRMIDGSVHCGPSAVLALKREGYHKTDFSTGDVADLLTFGGFWKMAARHFAAGVREVRRSLSKAEFARSLRRLVPAIQEEDLISAQAGVRAQAVMSDGSLVDDFLIVDGPRSIHVLNAPSPAATASLPIGQAIVERIPAAAKQRRSTPASQG